MAGLRSAVSPDHLDVDVGATGDRFPWLKIRLRSTTHRAGDGFGVEWTSYTPAEHSELTNAPLSTRQVRAAYDAAPGYHCYWLRMTDHPEWSGVIRRFRVVLDTDVSNPPPPGTVVTIDYVKLAEANDGECISNSP